MLLNKFSLKNKNILITGAAGSLGLEHSIALLNVGARVIMTDIDLVKLNKNKIELLKKNKNFQLVCLKMDVSSESSVKKILKILKKKQFKLDVLINNACLNPKFDTKFKNNKTALEKFSLKNWEREIKVGLTGAFICSKIFGNYMKNNKKGGVIINIASEYSVVTPDHRIYSKNNFKPITYPVIKTGLIGLTKYLATYWAENNIRVNCLSPGGVYNNQPEEFYKNYTEKTMLKKMSEPEDLVSAILYLVSDASGMVTGINHLVDGGYTAW